MPITKSAKKALRVSKTKREQNLAWERKLEKGLKILKSDKAENASEVISIIDKAAKNKIISRGRADRLKSRLAKKFGTAKTKQIKSQNSKTKITTEKLKTTEKKSVKGKRKSAKKLEKGE